MRLLITPSNPKYTFVLFDTETGEDRRIESLEAEADPGANESRPPHRPFGITWDKDNVYVANRRNICVYDKDLKFVDKVENVLCQNPHQIAYHRGQVLACMTCHDCIAFIDLQTKHRYFFHPHEGWRDLEGLGDTMHINGVVGKEDLIYIGMNNRAKKPSQVAVLDMRTKCTEWIVDVPAVQSHGLYVGPEGLGTLDTGDRHDMVIGKRRASIYASDNNFLRGMASNGKLTAAAHFPRRERRYRDKGSSSIKIVENETMRVIGSRLIEDIGAVNDMRLLCESDFCHHNEFELCC